MSNDWEYTLPIRYLYEKSSIIQQMGLSPLGCSPFASTVLAGLSKLGRAAVSWRLAYQKWLAFANPMHRWPWTAFIQS